jgi:hypothetical protein
MLLITSVAISGGGQIYGKITTPMISKKREPIQIEIKCENRVQNAWTDESGSYRLFVPGYGECSIRIFYNNIWTEPYQIFVSRNPSRYNFSIVVQMGKNKNIKYILQRY